MKGLNGVGVITKRTLARFLGSIIRIEPEIMGSM